MRNTKKELVEIFQKTKYQPEADLETKIWHAIVIHDRKIAQLKLWAFGSAGIMSIIALIPTLKVLVSDFAKSGFYEYFSLLFSSGNLVYYWKELSLSLAESLPAISITLTLSLLFICFLSLKNLLKQIFIRNQLNLIF